MKIKVGEFKETAKATSIWSIKTEMNKCHCHRRPMLLLKVIGPFCNLSREFPALVRYIRW